MNDPGPWGGATRLTASAYNKEGMFMKRLIWTLAVLLLLFMLPLAAQAETLHAGPGQMTLTSALEACGDGDIIELAGGTYLETVDIPEDNEMYAEGKRQVKVYRFEL